MHLSRFVYVQTLTFSVQAIADTGEKNLIAVLLFPEDLLFPLFKHICFYLWLK